MKKFHVHVYKLECMAEIDILAKSDQEAMESALMMAKSREVVCNKEPDNEFIAIPFPADKK